MLCSCMRVSLITLNDILMFTALVGKHFLSAFDYGFLCFCSFTLGTIYMTVILQSSSRRENSFYLNVQYMKYVINRIAYDFSGRTVL